MERLTTRHNGVAVIKDKSKHKEAMEKLARYEELEERMTISPSSLEIVKDGIKQYFIDLIEQDKQEVDILEANAENQKILDGVKKTNGWILVEEALPPDDSYILLSFGNYNLPGIGRFKVDKDGGGTFCMEDDDQSYSSYGIFVNAWMPLLEPYREEVESEEANERNQS